MNANRQKYLGMIFFFSIVLIIYTLVNLYLYKRTGVLIRFDGYWSLILRIALIVVMLAYPLGRLMEVWYPGSVSTFLIRIGSFWLGAMLYLTLLFLLADLIYLGFKIFGATLLFPLKANLTLAKGVTLATYGLTTLITIGGYINATHPRVNRISIESDKIQVADGPLRIVAASDIHLGTIIGNGRLKQFVHMVNQQQPDLILLAGDVFDEDLGTVIAHDMGKHLEQLHAPMGVFAIPGNHEYIGNTERAISYLQEHGIAVLRDSAVTLGEKITLVGRDDRQSAMMGGGPRTALSELMQAVNPSCFIVLLDHQPYHLNEAVENGVDLQISGHTHHGQLFPLNYITKAIFEVSRGYKQIDGTHFYVSTGFGTWGPPMRIGNRPEIVVFEIKPHASDF